jgi:hypothetical protein
VTLAKGKRENDRFRLLIADRDGLNDVRSLSHFFKITLNIRDLNTTLLHLAFHAWSKLLTSFELLHNVL